MGLAPEVLARRIEAGRALRGISQEDLGAKLKAEGIGKHDAARIERREDDAPPMAPSRRAALSRVLQLPEWWWTATDDELTATLSDDARTLRDEFEGLRDSVNLIQRQLVVLTESRTSGRENEEPPHTPGTGDPG
jgi:transcriptional regulator with XRE-family HTH domain